MFPNVCTSTTPSLDGKLKLGNEGYLRKAGQFSDLLTLKYADLNLDECSLKLTEAKAGKLKTIRLNPAAILVIVRRQQENPVDTWLFQVHSNRAKDKPVSRVSVNMPENF